MIRERIKDMDVSVITDPIQTQSPSIVHPGTPSDMPLGHGAQPTVDMLRRLAPNSADVVLDYIDDHARRLKATADSYAPPAPPARGNSTDQEAGLITAYPLSGHYSIASPVASSGNQPGGSAGAHYSSSSYSFSPTGAIPVSGSASTKAPVSVSLVI